jgi:hypothetical protein
MRLGGVGGVWVEVRAISITCPHLGCCIGERCPEEMREGGKWGCH